MATITQHQTFTEDTDLMTPEYARELAIVSKEMERPPYWFPDDTERLRKATALVAQGKVQYSTFGDYEVTGSKGTNYIIQQDTRECPCPQGQKAKTKWCYHLIATVIHPEVTARVGTPEPSLFPTPKTVDERLAQTPQDGPGQAITPQPDQGDIATLATPVAPTQEGKKAMTMATAPANDAHTPTPELPQTLDAEQLTTYRHTIVRQLAVLGLKPQDKHAFEDAIMEQVGLVLAPENFPLITSRLSEVITSRAQAAPRPVPDEYLVDIKGKKHILFTGLLAMAHEHGLLTLNADFISVTPELALARATATFADGRSFTEAGDATPANVGPQVKPHFARMALTRAKARCLRDALNVHAVSAEEVE
jgi:hypothetical protein